jgi:hypothetical protein
VAVKLTVMDATERDRELVADPAPERTRLREPKMMGIRRHPAAHKARLSRYEFPVIFVAQADGFAQCTYRTIGMRFTLGRRSCLAGAGIVLVRALGAWDARNIGRPVIRLAVAERRQYHLKPFLDDLGVGRREGALGGKTPMGPGGRLISRFKALKLGQKPIPQGCGLIWSENGFRVSEEGLPIIALR